VTVTGRVEAATVDESKVGAPVLRASGTDQRFYLRMGSASRGWESQPMGELLRVTGRVTRGSERNEDEIWLELERVEPYKPGP
jgi:hypothetical protein